MCGRLVQKFEEPELREIVNLKNLNVPLTPRYNIAPSQQVAVLIPNEFGELDLDSLKWGFLPYWAKPEQKLRAPINARAEGIESKPFFRSAFSNRRCLVPISGFYEWKVSGKTKQPYFIYGSDNKPFLLAAIWENSKDTPERTFCIITTEPNQDIAAIHNRMPVIIAPLEINNWLCADSKQALGLLRPSTQALSSYTVSNFVNSPKNSTEKCLEPALGSI